MNKRQQMELSDLYFKPALRSLLQIKANTFGMNGKGKEGSLHRNIETIKKFGNFRTENTNA